MKAPLNMHPPKNWQDFETLCLKLWGEIWNIPHEIEFNSDNSQGQNGVDIYGALEDGCVYYGIQCKNKKLNLIDGSPNRITIKDVQEEIDKAKSFKPELRKLIIATSLPKDSAIEQYVREKSFEHAKSKLFTIQICFWEFFERKLPEFERVYNWYIKNEDFERRKQISVSFKHGTTIKTYYPKFQKNINRFLVLPSPKPVLIQPNKNETLVEMLERVKDDPSIFPNRVQLEKFGSIHHNKIDWHQYLWIKLYILNTGDTVIEDYKIELEFEGDFVKVGPEEGDLFNRNFKNDVKGYKNSNRALYIEPHKKTLVQNDGFVSGNFYIEPDIAKQTDIKINWTLLSRDFTETGVLIIRIVPKYYVVTKDHSVNDPSEEKEDISYSLIKRQGIISIGGPYFNDKESDYTFE